MKGKVKKVEIEWLDSIQDKIVWQWIDECVRNAKNSKEVFKSIGYLIYQNKKITLLATSLHFPYGGKKENKNIEKIGSIFIIPTGAIIKIKQL